MSAVPLCAQVSLDGTLGRSGPLTGPNYQITADLGRQVGGNLFHSFKDFNLKLGDSATFSGPGSAQNVIARVTGGQRSEIHGSIRSEIPGSNLYLVNPSGVVLGGKASANVDGSFVVSTADYLKLGSSGRFDATHPTQTVLSSAPVEAFGFLGDHVGRIEITGAQIVAKEGKHLSFVGGKIDFKDSQARATGGRINVISMGSVSEVREVTLEGSSNSAIPSGEINLSNETVLDAGGGGQVIIPVVEHDIPGVITPFKTAPAPSRPGGGQIQIRAGQLVLDHSAIYQTTELDGKGGGIDLALSRDLNLNASHVVTTALGSGEGGKITIQAGSMTLADHSYIKATTGVANTGRSGKMEIATGNLTLFKGSQLVNDSFGPGDTGDLDVDVIGKLLMDSQGSASETILGTNASLPPTGGKPGKTTVRVGDLRMFNQLGGGLVGLGSRSLGQKSPGEVVLHAQEIHLDGQGATSTLAGQEDSEVTAIGSVNFRFASGPSGKVTITASMIELKGYSIISAATFGQGNAGDVDVRAQRIVLQDSAIVSSAAPNSSGDGGTVHVEAEELEISGAAGVGARTSASGNAGKVSVVAPLIRLDQGGSIYADARGGATGRGGQVEVKADDLILRDGGNIGASTVGPGDGGSVTVEAMRISMDGTRPFKPKLDLKPRFLSTFQGTGIGSQSLSPDTKGGKGGTVSVTATEIIEMLGSDASISAKTRTEGRGGDIKVETGRLKLREDATINSASSGSGDSGNIKVTTTSGSIHLAQGGAITTAAEASRAGQITVTSAERIQLERGEISSRAAKDGGETHLEAAQRIHLSDSRVTTKAGGTGGDIFLKTPIGVLNASEINANAHEGNGGNIRIAVDFLLSSDARLRNITASSDLSVNGQISILGPAVDLTGSLTALPGSFLVGESSLPEHCSVNLGRNISSFLLTGRGGLPIDPFGWQPTFLPSNETPNGERSSSKGTPVK